MGEVFVHNSLHSFYSFVSVAEFIQQKESDTRAEYRVLQHIRQHVTVLKMLEKVEWPGEKRSLLRGRDGDTAWQRRGVQSVGLGWVWVLQGQMLIENPSSQSEGSCGIHIDFDRVRDCVPGPLTMQSDAYCINNSSRAP